MFTYYVGTNEVALTYNSLFKTFLSTDQTTVKRFDLKTRKSTDIS